MSLFQRLSKPLHHWQARLRPLAQPLFWGPIGVVFLVGLFVWEISVHPEWLAFDTSEDAALTEGTDGNSSDPISEAEKANLAEIDSLPVLVEELNANGIAHLNTPITQGKGLFRELNTDSGKSSTSPSLSPATDSLVGIPSPGIPTLSLSTENQNQSLFGISPETNFLSNSLTLNGNSTQPLTTATTQSPLATESDKATSSPPENTTSVNQLQKAMEQYLANPTPTQPIANPANPTTSAIPTVTVPGPQADVNGANPLYTTATPITAPVLSKQPNPSLIPTPPTNPAANPYQTNLSIPSPVPITPATIPSPIPLGNPIGINDPSSYNYPNPRGGNSVNSNFQNSQPNSLSGTVQPLNLNPQPTQLEAPFSVPRSVPGQYIGGGEINTFADP